MSRIYTGGFEFSNIIDNGILSVDSEVTISTINARKSAGNNGGSRALEANTTGINNIVFQPFQYELSESYIRMYFNIEALASTHRYIFYDSGGASEVFRFELVTPTGPLRLLVNGVPVATGTKTFVPNTFYAIKIYGLISGAGQITMEVDGLIDINYLGVTNGGGTGWDQIRLITDGHIVYDDFAVNDTYTRVNYSGGNGVVAPSGTLTGPGSSGTIINHVGDGTTGYFIINNLGVPFANGIAISDSTTFTGNTSATEDASSTGPLPDGFVQLFYPDGNGNTAQLTNSNDDAIDNYTYVNNFEDSATFVYGELPSIGDTYTVSNIPGEAISVNHVDTCFYTKRDGATISNIRSTIRVNSTDYDSHTKGIPGSYRWVKFSVPENPDTDAPWTISEIDGAEMGPKIES